MPRFAILEHDYPSLHWDLMLEAGEVLLTWRLDAIPGTGRTMVATRLAAHRLAYLEYEGPISGNRGVVSRWDFGEFSWIEEVPGCLHLSLRGRKYVGLLELQEVAPDNWEARFHS